MAEPAFDDDEDDRPRTVTDLIAEIVSRVQARDIIQDLWSAGWTITRRRRGDPFDVPAEIIPRGMSYQWCARGESLGAWVPVPASRHPGIFMPMDYVGDIEVGACVLCERDKNLVDAVHAAAHAKAQKNVDDWIERHGGQFSGGVRVWTGDENAPPPTFRKVGAPSPALERAVFTSRVENRPDIGQTPIPPPVPPPPSRQSWLARLLCLFSTKD